MYGQAKMTDDSHPGYQDAESLTGRPDPMLAIERQFRWKMLFFGCACTSFVCGFITMLSYILTFEMFTAPASFVTTSCLTGFGFMMLVLDAPVPHTKPWLLGIRDGAYKFVLFLTRFTGRGIFYVWLGTLVWVTMYDEGTGYCQYFIGILGSTYLVVVGALACWKGYILTKQLSKIKENINEYGRAGFPKGMSSMSKDQFHELVNESVNTPRGGKPIFTEHDLDYAINAIASHAYHGNTISAEEYERWVNAEWPAIV